MYNKSISRGGALLQQVSALSTICVYHELLEIRRKKCEYPTVRCQITYFIATMPDSQLTSCKNASVSLAFAGSTFNPVSPSLDPALDRKKSTRTQATNQQQQTKTRYRERESKVNKVKAVSQAQRQNKTSLKDKDRGLVCCACVYLFV